MLPKHHDDVDGHDSYDSDLRSETTMEEELASCKAAADMVGDMVVAEEGRSRQVINERNMRSSQGLPQSRDVPPAGIVANCLPDPRNSDSAFGIYVSANDVPPAYDDGSAEASSVVADGLRHPDDLSRYTPSSAGSQDSWDEVGQNKR